MPNSNEIMFDSEQNDTTTTNENGSSPASDAAGVMPPCGLEEWIEKNWDWLVEWIEKRQPGPRSAKGYQKFAYNYERLFKRHLLLACLFSVPSTRTLPNGEEMVQMAGFTVKEGRLPTPDDDVTIWTRDERIFDDAIIGEYRIHVEAA